jgi:hypothetical protein
VIDADEVNDVVYSVPGRVLVIDRLSIYSMTYKSASPDQILIPENGARLGGIRSFERTIVKTEPAGIIALFLSITINKVYVVC